MLKLTYDEIRSKRLTESEAAKSERRFPVIAILENIRSLYNVGSIFRTSDGAHLEAIYTVGYTPHPPRPEIDKTALGATKTVPSLHFDTVEDAIAAARQRGFRIAALEIARDSRSVFELDQSDFPLAFVIGNEITGVSEAALRASDFAVEIPMIGAKHSLNVAVSFGITVFECLRVFRDTLDQFR
jgi:23S rRNA (guanosine2251-2'-O)-methyltransferase